MTETFTDFLFLYMTKLGLYRLSEEAFFWVKVRSIDSPTIVCYILGDAPRDAIASRNIDLKSLEVFLCKSENQINIRKFSLIRFLGRRAFKYFYFSHNY